MLFSTSKSWPSREKMPLVRTRCTSMSRRSGLTGRPRGSKGPPAAEQGLGDAFARHGVGGAGGVAHQEGPTATRGQWGVVDPGRDGPRLVDALGPGPVAQHLPDVGPGEDLGPQPLHVVGGDTP